MNLKQTSYFQKTNQLLHGHYHQAYSVTLFFFVLCLLTALLTFLSPVTLFFTVPLVVAPGFFMLIASTGGFTQEKDFTFQNVNVWAIFRNYFSPSYFGCFRMLRNLFRGVLAFVLASFVTGSILSGFGEAIWPGFTLTMNELQSLLNNASMLDIYQFIQGNSILSSFIMWTQCVAFFFGVLSFLQGLSFYAMNAYLCASVQTNSPKMELALYRDTLRRNRALYYKKTWSLSWPLLPLFAVGLWGGMLLGMLFTNDSFLLWAFGLVGMSIMMSAYLPFYTVGLSVMYNEMEVFFMNYSLEAVEKAIQELEGQEKIQKEDLDTMKKSLEDFKKSVEDVQKIKSKERDSDEDSSKKE